MIDLPDLWGEYARLQRQLADRNRVTSSVWGLEAALNRLLAAPGEVPTREDVERTVRSDSRNERHRTALRLIWVRPAPPAPPIDAVLDARRHLDFVKKEVSHQDWGLLEAVGEGHDYAELAAAHNMTAGALRARVFRLRRNLRGSLEGRQQMLAG